MTQLYANDNDTAVNPMHHIFFSFPVAYLKSFVSLFNIIKSFRAAQNTYIFITLTTLPLF